MEAFLLLLVVLAFIAIVTVYFRYCNEFDTESMENILRLNSYMTMKFTSIILVFFLSFPLNTNAQKPSTQYTAFAELDVALIKTEAYSGFIVLDSCACTTCFIDFKWNIIKNDITSHKVTIKDSNNKVTTYICSDYDYSRSQNTASLQCYVSDKPIKNPLYTHLLIIVFKSLDSYTDTYFITSFEEFSKGKLYHVFNEIGYNPEK